MKTIVIENLTIDTELDRQALASVHGRGLLGSAYRHLKRIKRRARRVLKSTIGHYAPGLFNNGSRRRRDFRRRGRS
jgi:hypothetical protein